MQTDWQTDPALPAAVRQGLEKFTTQVREALGDQLVSLILYGGLAKGEFTAGRSDVNVMLVLQSVTVDTLDRLAPLLEQARVEWQLSPFTLAEEDLRIAADVFPVKFMDIRRAHRVLWGRAVLAGMDLSRDRLRRQCARDLENLLLRLRQFYLQRSRRPELLEATLNRASSSFLFSLGVAVELKTGTAPANKAAIVVAADQLGLNSQLLRDLLALKRGELKPDAAGVKRLYGDFLQTVQQAARLVDQIQ